MSSTEIKTFLIRLPNKEDAEKVREGRMERIMKDILRY